MNIIGWSLEKTVNFFFYIFHTADDTKSSILASLHKGIKAKRQDTFVPLALPIPLMLHVKVVAINLTSWDDERAEDSDRLKWGSRI